MIAFTAVMLAPAVPSLEHDLPQPSTRPIEGAPVLAALKRRWSSR